MIYIHISFMYLLPYFTQKLNTQELCMNTLTLERKYSSADIARFFFGLTNTSHIQLNLIQDSLFVVLVVKLSFRNHCQHLISFMTCLTIYLVRNPEGLAQIFVPTTLCLLVYPWEQMLIN